MDDKLKKVRIRDVGHVVTGKTPPTARKELFGEDFPFITPTDIKDFDTRYLLSTERGLSSKGYQYQRRYLLPRNAICYVCIGSTIGKICLAARESFTNQQINSLIVDCKYFDPMYVFYLLRFITPQIQTISAGSGSGKAILNKSSFEQIEAEVHALPSQRKIAAVLSAYDDLIENNTRRVKILEEIAQMIYREWFVHFRFPGHKTVRMVESELGMIPVGWKIRPLGEVADVQWGDTSTTKASYVDEGFDAYSGSGLDGKVDHYDFNRKGIVLSAIGANCGKTWFASGKWSCIKNTIRFWATSEALSTEYLFYATSNPNVWRRRGAAQPFISQGDAKELSVLCPEGKVLAAFTKFVGKQLELARILDRKNSNLRRICDLLLPRLISGEIDVENLNIDTEQLA